MCGPVGENATPESVSIGSVLILSAMDCLAALKFLQGLYEDAHTMMAKTREEFGFLRKRSTSANLNARNLSGISWIHQSMCLSLMGKGREALRMAVKGVEALTRSRLAGGRGPQVGDWTAAEGWFNMAVVARNSGDMPLANAAAMSAIRSIQEAPNSEKQTLRNRRTVTNLQFLLGTLEQKHV